MRSTRLSFRALGISKLLQQRVASASPQVTSVKIEQQSNAVNFGALLESPEITRLIEASSAPQRLDGTNLSASSPAAVLGQLMASVASVQSSQIATHCISEWIQDALGITKLTGAGGGVVTCPSSADAMLLAIGSALQRSGKNASQATIYVGENVIPRGLHAATQLGIPVANVKPVPSASEGGMDMANLQQLIEADAAAGVTPLCVIANISTRHDGKCDSAKDVTALCRQLHLECIIDAGFTAFAAVEPQYRSLFEGWDNADAIVFEAGSWLPCGSNTGFAALRDVSAVPAGASAVPTVMRVFTALRTFGLRGIQERVNHSALLSAELKKALRAERIAVVNVPHVPGTVTIPMNFEEDAREVAEECRVRSGLHVAARGQFIRVVLPATVRLSDVPAIARVIASSASDATRHYHLVQLTPQDLSSSPEWSSLPDSVDALIKCLAQSDAVNADARLTSTAIHSSSTTSSIPVAGSPLLDIVTEFRAMLKPSA